MADDQPKSRNELISEILRIYDELRNLNVYVRVVNLTKMDDLWLADEADSRAEQLKNRRKFLGVKL